MTEVYDSKAPKMMQGISKLQPSRLFFQECDQICLAQYRNEEAILLSST